MMNIGLVTPYFPDKYTLDSGLANHFSTLAEALSKLGHNVVVVHIRPKYEDEDNIPTEQKIDDNTTLLTYKASLSRSVEALVKNKWSYRDFLVKINCMLITARRLSSIKKKYKLDIIETSSYFSLCYFYLLARPKTPVVIRVSTTFLQMMNDFYPFKSRLYRFLGAMEIKMIGNSKHLITHAKGHADELHKLYGINSDKFTIIPHGIRLPVENLRDVPATGIIKILFVGRFEYRKGTDVLLQAIPLVIAKHPDVAFELIGTDPNKEYETNFRKANDKIINQKVFFSGKLDSAGLNEAYQNCDTFVAPSRYESFGLIYIEAMSYGKPVIGCPVGGVTDLIEDGFNGLFSEAGNATDLAEKIGQLIANPELLKKLGNHAKTTVHEKFSQDVLGRNSVSYYQSIINSKN